MKKVVLLKSNINRKGGLEKNAWKIAEALYRKGHPVTILTTNPTPIYHAHFSIKSYPQNKLLPSFYKIQAFDNFCKNQIANDSSQIIFGMDRNRYQTHIRAGNGVHKAYLERRKNQESFFKAFSFPINPLHRLVLDIEKTAFESPFLQKLLVNSFLVKNEVLKYYNVDPAKIHVIHNGVEYSEMQLAFEKSFSLSRPLLQSCNYKKKDFTFLFIGNGYARKGLTQILQAMSKIKEKPFHLLVVGKDKKSVYYQKLANELGLSEKVSFFGPQNNITPFYQVSDALILPSFYDPFANVTVEALAMGLFVITSKDNGASEVINSSSGLVLENVQDIATLSSALEYSISHKQKTKLLAHTIRKTVEHLDYNLQLEKVMEILFS
ncbi:MAG: hypothetical protein COT84_03855 [Chlamydiae bacterium CG10_big_fil_rev_8_21_14_0_10_35_9]|nr:MAG: hypothetical protein COT84_03855 [Chlamydiae bacterium CG10_big_fil_rev_8_21_14_0_10_35_9]